LAKSSRERRACEESTDVQECSIYLDREPASPARSGNSLDDRRYRARAVTISGLLAGSGDSALEVVIVLSIVVPLTVLAVVCWIFWRAARRVDATGAPLHDDRLPRP
jgi:hypothetical protein